MTKEYSPLHRSDQTEGYRLCLLLFFLSGALLARYGPMPAGFFAVTDRCLPLLLLIPALFSGHLLGSWLIPSGALLLGASAMGRLTETAQLSQGISPEALRILLPVLVLTPLFFLSAVNGMGLSEDCLLRYLQGDRSRRTELFLRQIILWTAALGVLSLYRILR